VREKYYLLNKKVRLISQANRTRNARAHHPLEPFFSPAGGSMFCLLGANFFCIRTPWPKCLHPQPNWREPTAACKLQLGSPAASSINARTYPGRRPNRTEQACGRYDCKLRPSLRLHASSPRSRGLLCRSSLHLLGLSEFDDHGWPSQAAGPGRTGQRPAASAAKNPGSHQKRS